jgi:hypothetical protein
VLSMVLKPYCPFFLLIFSVVASASAAGDESGDYCVRAQQIIADTDLVARLNVHTDYDGFVESKALADPLTVQQYFSNPSPGADGMQTVLSCKMKTAERINAANPVAEGTSPPAGVDSSCQAIHQAWLDRMVQQIPGEQLQLSPEKLEVDEEDLTFMGPMWLRPWPFEPLYRGDDGKLHIRSRALYVPYSWWIPMPDRFKGTYYCHLISPLYLEALLRGDIEVGV